AASNAQSNARRARKKELVMCSSVMKDSVAKVSFATLRVLLRIPRCCRALWPDGRCFKHGGSLPQFRIARNAGSRAGLPDQRQLCAGVVLETTLAQQHSVAQANLK